jgi:hypothetical protein
VRPWVEPVEHDHLVEATFVAEPLQQREVPGGDPTVAAEELRWPGQRPEPLKVERAAAKKLLHGPVHFLVRPLERDRNYPGARVQTWT